MFAFLLDLELGEIQVEVLAILQIVIISEFIQELACVLFTNEFSTLHSELITDMELPKIQVAELCLELVSTFNSHENENLSQSSNFLRHAELDAASHK